MGRRHLPPQSTIWGMKYKERRKLQLPKLNFVQSECHRSCHLHWLFTVSNDYGASPFQLVLGSINDTCIMIRIMILKSIKYQVSWYIFGRISVSVSLIHFDCISIKNRWYIKPDTFTGFRNFDKECINYLSDTETELTMLARYSRTQKVFIKFNTTQPSSAHVQRLFSSAGQRLECHVATIWVTQS